MSEYLGRTSPDKSQISEILTEEAIPSVSSLAETEKVDKTVEEKNIQLLEERLVIDSRRRRIGEVIVRKQIEIQMLQVPIRREKLIVEQVSPEHQQLAEINLGQGEFTSTELTHTEGLRTIGVDGGLTVSGEFISPKIASLLLNAIALEPNHKCQKVKLIITVEDASQQQKYQEWFDRCTKKQSDSSD